MNPIAATSSVTPIGLPSVGNQTAAPKPGGGKFSELVENFVAQTNEAQVSSDQAIDDLITGKTDNIQQVVMAVANAELSFQLFMEIRNKLIDSYNELMRMQF